MMLAKRVSPVMAQTHFGILLGVDTSGEVQSLSDKNFGWLIYVGQYKSDAGITHEEIVS